jgi:hypothetical protein
MFNERGLSLIETLVAVVIGAAIVLGIGGLGERMFHHGSTNRSNSGAIDIAERTMESLLADSVDDPTSTQCAASPKPALCGDTTSTGLLHGPTPVNGSATPAAGGEYSVRWWVKDNSANTDSPLLKPTAVSGTVKQLKVQVTHSNNPAVNANLTRYTRP